MFCIPLLQCFLTYLCVVFLIRFSLPPCLISALYFVMPLINSVPVSSSSVISSCHAFLSYPLLLPFL